MSSQPGAPDAPPPDDGDDDSRLHIRAITEMPAGHDAELATIFREMRRASGISQAQMAGRLATPLETIEALENGALLALPEWPELTRIITAYAALLGLDSRPIMRRLEGQLGANQPASSPGLAAPGPPMPPSAMAPPPPSRAAPPSPRRSPLPRPPGAAPPPPSQPQPQARATAPAPEKKPKGRMARLMRGALSWAVLIGFVAALGSGVWYAAKSPRKVWSALDTLPEPIPRIVRSAWNFMRPLDNKSARPPVSDPDNRKSDKLP